MRNNLSDILIESAQDYYSEIIQNRALPDYRDGLTQVQRRILYDCSLRGWNHTKPHVKSARISGDVVGVFHPHGDSSVYSTMCNMNKWFLNYLPLMDFHGSSGSIDGLPAASSRYTEARSSKEADEYVLKDLSNNSVDYQPNYSQDDKEPIVLPTKLPILLFNGSFGLSAGYMTSIPTHNPNDILDELIKKIKTPGHKIKLLPDFPSGGIITNKDEIMNAYGDFITTKDKGTARIINRAKIVKTGTNQLTITELPYMKSALSVIESIINVSTKKTDKKGKTTKKPKINSINSIKNLTAGNIVKIVINTKRGHSLDEVIESLYKYTACQSTFGINFITVDNGKLLQFKSIDEYFEKFLEFRRTTIKRIKGELIKKYKLRIHILDGLIYLHDNDLLDKLFELAKSSKGKADLVNKLKKEFKFTDVQANYIADTKIYAISKLELKKLKDEQNSLKEKVESELVYFRDSKALDKLMIDEYRTIKKSFKNVKRRTEIL